MHNFLSAYYLYTNLSKGLPFLECLKTVLGIKVTDRSFKTILDTLNNLTKLILQAPNNNIKIRIYCVSSFSDNESLSPFCSNDLKKKCIYIHTSPSQDLTLAWQSQIEKTIFLKNQWNELLRGYMDNGEYCTYCTDNCIVSMTCLSSNIPLRKSNT